MNKIIFVLRIILGFTFVLSAYTKFISPGIIEIILVEHKIANSRELAAVFVNILISLELGLGLLLLQKNFLKKLVLPASFFFLSVFSIYLIYTGFIIGDQQNCGCFGTMIEMSPIESLIKNLILILIVIIIFVRNENDNKNKVQFATTIIISFLIVFSFLPIKKNYDEKFSKYTNFEKYGRVDLSEGKKLIAVMNTECEHCQHTAYELGKMKKQFKWFPKILGLYFSEGQVSVDSFETITKFEIPYKLISASEFFNLVGQSPPRIYFLENGKVKEYWDKDFVKNITLNFSKND
ncbi:MAG: hypothetical protein N2321_03970 [Melioribacteraceae bacterium]|nr:hypothetical protein [Melioribacteraceae bacterium]